MSGFAGVWRRNNGGARLTLNVDLAFGAGSSTLNLFARGLRGRGVDVVGWNVWRGKEGDVNDKVNWMVGSEHVQKNAARPGMEPDGGGEFEATAGVAATDTAMYCR